MLFKDFLADQVIFENGYQTLRPEVTIVTPTYCRMKEGFLKRCMDSILAQTFTNFEMIIVDDGSSDGSQAFIEEYAKEDKRIVYVRHEQNAGLPAIRTDEGILLARGKYIAFAFDDNIFEPAFLETMLREAKESDADILFSVAKLPRKDRDPFYMGRIPLSMEMLAVKNCIANGSVLMKAAVFERVGLYDPHIIIARLSDWDLWLRALRAGCSFHFVDEVLSEEGGVTSEVSLGNTTNVDWKIALAYMFDERFQESKVQMLNPSAIGDYNVFDIHPLLRCVRSYYEMRHIENTVYDQYYEAHTDIYRQDPVYDSLFNVKSGMALYPLMEASFLSERPRILVVCNLFNERIQALFTLIQRQMPNAIILPCMEANVGLLNARDADLVLLVDCSEREQLLEHIQAWKKNDIPIGYCVFHAFSQPIHGAQNYAQHESIQEENRDYSVYFPNEGVPMNKTQQENALGMMEIVDFVLDGSEAPGVLEKHGIKTVSYAFIEQHNVYFWSILQHYLHNKTCCVFINSSLLAGSEVYGIIMGKLLQTLHLRTKVFMPSSDLFKNYGNKSALEELAVHHGLDGIELTEYTPGAYYTTVDNGSFLDMLESQQAGFLFASSLIAEVALAADALRVPSMFAMFSPANYRPQELGLLKRCQAGVISDCQRTCDIYNKTVKLDSIRIIDYIEESKYGQHVHQTQETIYIASAGTLVPRKQQFEVVRACHHLLQKGYAIVVNIYGYSNVYTTYVDQIKDYVRKHKLDDSIILHGFVEDDREITKNNDVIVTASVEEGLPQGILFNMAAGLVAVATPVGGIGEVVIDGETGYLAKGFGVDNFEEALMRALDNREQWPQIIENAEAHLRRECSLEKLTGDLLPYMAKRVAMVHATVDRLPQSAGWSEATQPRTIHEDMITTSTAIAGSCEYPVTVYLPKVSSIGIIITSYDGCMAGSVSLSIHYRGKQLRQSTLKLEEMTYNEWTYFPIAPLRGYQGQNVMLRLTFTYQGNAKAVVYEDLRNYTTLVKVGRKLKKQTSTPNILFVDMQ